MAHPFADLVEHAAGKLAEEQSYHDAMAKAGRKVHGGRRDRRPLWAATIVLARYFAEKPVPTGVNWRGDAWGWLCEEAKRVMANENQFDAIIRMALVMRMPRADAQWLLAERAEARVRREGEAREARAEHLRAELRRIEGVSTTREEESPLPSNVIAFPVRKSA